MATADHDGSTNTVTTYTVINNLRIIFSRLTKKPRNPRKLGPLKFSSYTIMYKISWRKVYSYMYVVALCVCLLQICQLTCVPVEEVRIVLQAYTAIKLIILSSVY